MALIVLVSNFEGYFTFFIMTKVCYVLEDIIDLIATLVPIELMKKNLSGFMRISTISFFFFSASSES